MEQVGHAQWVFTEFVARVLVQIPDPRRHLVRYYGAYSNATRGKREKAAASADPSSPHEAPEDAAIPDGPYRGALRRRWAELIRRVYEVDPAPLEIRPARLSQAARKGRRVGPSSVPKPSRSLRRSPHPWPRP